MGELEALLIRIDQALGRARLEHDLAAYDRLTDESYIGVDAGGVLTTKSERIAGFYSVTYSIFESDNYQVRFYGDVAIVTAQLTAVGVHEDQPFSGHYRYTHTYYLRNGEWRLVSAHTCHIS